MSHDVRAAPGGVSVDRLVVGGPNDGKQSGDDYGDGDRGQQSRRAGHHQHQQDLFGGIRHRREGIRRKHSERFGLREALVPLSPCRQRTAEQKPFQRSAHVAAVYTPLRGQSLAEFCPGGTGDNDVILGGPLRLPTAEWIPP